MLNIFKITKNILLALNFKIDHAVTFAVLSRGFQALIGLLNLYFIAHYFSLETQGYYYTFMSLLALQSFAELGFYIVIVSLASHEWGDLKINARGEIIGKPSAKSRLSHLTFFVMRWYSIVSFLFLSFAATAGYFFLAQKGTSSIIWVLPWISVVVVSSFQLWALPLLSILEGCNQVVELNIFRFWQVILEGITAAILFTMNLGLWVIVGVVAIRSISTYYFLFYKNRHFFWSLLRSTIVDRISWRKEIWPMQWRLSIQGVMNYFANSLFVPIMFQYHGPLVAGQMGMTLQIITAVNSLAIVWVQTKVPIFGMLVSQRKFIGFKNLWIRYSRISFIQSGATSIFLLCILIFMNKFQFTLASRFLDPITFGIFLLSYLLLQLSQYQSFYLRAFAKEPFLLLGTIGALVIGIAVQFFGKLYGPAGAGLSLLCVTVGFIVPYGSYIWIKKSNQWQMMHNNIRDY